MKKLIDELNFKQIDHAVAIAQGWKKQNIAWYDSSFEACALISYSPTGSYYDSGKLIDKFFISTEKTESKGWKAWIVSKNNFPPTVYYDKSRLVAACKAFLWFVYPDGYAEVYDDENLLINYSR